MVLLFLARGVQDITSYSFTNIYQAPTNNVPGTTPGARHTKKEMAARPSKSTLFREAVIWFYTRDSGGGGHKAGGSLGFFQGNQEGATEEGDKDAVNGARLFPTFARAPVRGQLHSIQQWGQWA